MVRFENGRNFDVVQEDGYERWVVPPDEYEVMIVENGDLVENILFDIGEDGANFYISDSGDSPTGWTLRNLAWAGFSKRDDQSPHGEVSTSWAGKFNIVVSGDGLIQNVFMDNRRAGRNSMQGGGYTPGHHGGIVTLRNTFIAGFGNNAWYGSKPADEGGNGGATEFYDCYHRDNTVSQFRIGHNGVVENCVGVVNDPDGLRGTYTGGDSRRARGIWCRSMGGNMARHAVMYVSPDDVDPFANYFVQCYGESQGPEAVLHVDDAHANPDAPQIECVNCTGGSCPARLEGTLGNDLSNPLVQGVPLDPVMAARGERAVPDIPELTGGDGGNGGGTQPPTTTSLEITNDGSDRTSYEVVVDGEIVDTPGFGTGDSLSEDRTTATGFVRGGTDGIVYSGCVQAFSYDGPKPVVTRDGSQINADNVVECPPQDEPPTNGNGGDGNGGSNGDGSDTVDRAVQAVGALAIGGSILKIIRD